MIVLIRLDGPGVRLLVRELKAERGRVSEAQGIVLEALRRCGIDAKVWRPSDWPTIEATLRGEDATEIAVERTDAPDGARGG